VQIRTRMCISLDGFVSTPDGRHPRRGRGRERPERLLERVREANGGRDVHLVGGPRTIETFRALGALDKLGLLVLPFLMGEGVRLTPSVSTDSKLTLESEAAQLGGRVELTYDVV
jgi:dihydrofolate reductase